MRPATKRGTIPLACALLMMSAGVAAAQTTGVGAMAPQCVATVRPATTASFGKALSQRVHTDARTNAAFFFSLTADGAVRMTVKAAQLEVDKTVYPDGRYRVVLQAGDDRVSVAAAPGTVEVVRRNQGSRRVEVGRAADDDWLQVKVLLAGSKAVRLFRTLSYNLDPETLETPAGRAVLASDGAFGVLDGDVGAIGRLVRQMRAAQKTKIRPAALRQVFLDCFRKYADAVNVAMQEWVDCFNSFYPWDPRQYLCDFEWLLKAESAWFQFIACSAIPLKIE
jgi:hypothetical protein